MRFPILFLLSACAICHCDGFSNGKHYPAAAIACPEILIPLGSDYHGAQSRKYTPADICPFR